MLFISVARRLRQGNYHLLEVNLVCIVRSRIEIEPKKGFCVVKR